MTILKYYDETDAAWKPFVNNANDAVTLSGDQTIAGEKTFTEDVNVDGDIYSNGEHIFLAVHPVGSIYMSVSGVNPGTVYGGTWVAWGSGRVPVGVDTGQTEFNTVEKTGGAKNHHHGLGSGAAQIGSPSGNANALGFSSSQIGDLTGSKYSVGNTALYNASGHPNRSHNTALTGTTDSGSTLQPYITCYMWKRTA